MVAEVAGKRPETLTLADVRAHGDQVAAIERHVTRYGSSTDELARAMQRNGPFWASVASVYESSVVAVNAARSADQEPLQAVYPRATYSSTMRAILPDAPWVSPAEKQAALLLIERLQRRRICSAWRRSRGCGRPTRRCRPAGSRRPRGADPRAVYDSLRAPPGRRWWRRSSRLWRDQAKKPSRVALVVDSSGSMKGEKLPAAQRSLQAYLAQIGPRDTVGLFDFDNRLRPPVVVTGERHRRRAGGPLHRRSAGGRRHRPLRRHPPGARLAAQHPPARGDPGGGGAHRWPGQRLPAEPRRAGQRAAGSSGFASDERIGVFTMGYGDQGDFDADVLRRIAESNGGEFATGTPDSIRRRMEDLQLAF